MRRAASHRIALAGHDAIEDADTRRAHADAPANRNGWTLLPRSAMSKNEDPNKRPDQDTVVCPNCGRDAVPISIDNGPIDWYAHTGGLFHAFSPGYDAPHPAVANADLFPRW